MTQRTIELGDILAYGTCRYIVTQKQDESFSYLWHNEETHIGGEGFGGYTDWYAHLKDGRAWFVGGDELTKRYEAVVDVIKEDLALAFAVYGLNTQLNPPINHAQYVASGAHFTSGSVAVSFGTGNTTSATTNYVVTQAGTSSGVGGSA